MSRATALSCSTSSNAPAACAGSAVAHVVAAPTLRALAVCDVPAVLRIQAQCYGAEYVEGAGIFTRRLQAPHHCSWAAQADGEVVAYLAAYWSDPGKITPLQGDFNAPTMGNVLYLHDMAVAPHMAGRGIAAQLLQAALSQARARAGVQGAALVAVQGAHGYWARKGFAPSAPRDALQAAHLASYGPDAQYMQQVWQPPVSAL